MSHTHTAGFLLLIALWALVYLAHFPYIGPHTHFPRSAQNNSPSFNGSWFSPDNTQINDLEAVINGTDVFGFIFSDVYNPPGNASDGIRNWCNMPHVNSDTYPVPPVGYSLEYVEVVSFQSHHLTSRESSLLKVSRFTDITNVHRTLPIPFLENLTLGIAMMRAYSLMANH